MNEFIYLQVREYGPAAWNQTGDAYITKQNPKPWISEMYGAIPNTPPPHSAVPVDHLLCVGLMRYLRLHAGFTYGCAAVGVKVREDGDHMLYPGCVPKS